MSRLHFICTSPSLSGAAPPSDSFPDEGGAYDKHKRPDIEWINAATRRFTITDVTIDWTMTVGSGTEHAEGAEKRMGRGGGWIRLDWDEAEGSGEAAAANRSRCRNGRWRRERGGLTQRRGVADRLPGGGRFLTKNCVIDAYDF